MTRQELIKNLKKDEAAYLDFMYGKGIWEKHPSMYIGSMRRQREMHKCPECGCRVNTSDWEDYNMCYRCYLRNNY